MGNLDKSVIRRAELNETNRFPTTRSYMRLLKNQPNKTPRALHGVNCRTHQIGSHTRVYVTEQSQMLAGDYDDHNIPVTNKSEENYECTTVKSIQSSYNVIVFKNNLETGDPNKDQTAYLGDGFCSCDNCRKATVPADFLNCRNYEKYEIMDQNHSVLDIYMFYILQLLG